MARAEYGAGSIRQRGEGRWELRVFAGRDPATGRLRYVSRSVRGTKKQAVAALAALVTEVGAGAGGHKGDIDLFYRSLPGKKFAASTIREIHNILAGSLDQAVRWG